ncbi:MAG TPA: hypothetical protein VF459_13305 [Caulobacteraceae bacterium]
MGFGLTAGLAAAALAVTVLFAWLGARPIKLMSAPRLVPYRILMLFSFTLAVMLAAHLVGIFKGS